MDKNTSAVNNSNNRKENIRTDQQKSTVRNAIAKLFGLATIFDYINTKVIKVFIANIKDKILPRFRAKELAMAEKGLHENLVAAHEMDVYIQSTRLETVNEEKANAKIGVINEHIVLANESLDIIQQSSADALSEAKKNGASRTDILNIKINAKDDFAYQLEVTRKSIYNLWRRMFVFDEDHRKISLGPLNKKLFANLSEREKEVNQKESKRPIKEFDDLSFRFRKIRDVKPLIRHDRLITE